MNIDIHQEATFRYLLEIKKYLKQNPIRSIKSKEYGTMVNLLYIIEHLSDTPNTENDYKSLYTQLHEAADTIAKYELLSKRRKNNSPLDGLFIKLFENDSNIHDFIAKNVLPKEGDRTSTGVQANLQQNTTAPSALWDITHPDNKLNAFFCSMLGLFDYNPLKRNNVPYVAFNEKQLQQDKKCLRIGAQTQDANVVNPSFERYLLANTRKETKARDEDKDYDYDYVYISLLKRNETSQNTQKSYFSQLLDRFVRFSEGSRASSLEALNEKEDLKTAVISLPADNEYLERSFSMDTGSGNNASRPQSLEAILNDLKDNIKHNRNDFYFSDKVKAKLFGKRCDNGKIEKLFSQAAQEILGAQAKGSMSKVFLNDEQRTALLFHFIKSNLTSHILKTLDPKAYNITCKDAIDRGGIHTLWYHMELMHKKGTPLSEVEFFKYLDTPAMIVKYRPLNHNRNLLWNVLKHRMESDVSFRESHPWAVDWLLNNAPSGQPDFSFNPQKDIKKIKSDKGIKKANNQRAINAIKKAPAVKLEDVFATFSNKKPVLIPAFQSQKAFCKIIYAQTASSKQFRRVSCRKAVSAA
tara:strand:- start:2878 stop:4620 length:1743 start_codon:yes stop_codon:yes gene_type:complete